MAVVGRSLSDTSIEQLAATFETNITSAADEGKVAYYNNANSQWELLTGIDVNQISQNLVGVISRISVDGDGLGTKGSGFVTLKGSVQKSGAVAGQAYFVGLTSNLQLTPPVDSPAIRVGYSQQNDFVYVDVDPNTIEIAILNDRVSSLETTVAEQGALLAEIAEEVIAAPVYNFGADDLWAVNPEDPNTNFGLDDQWTEGTVEYNANFGADDAWAELVPE